MIELSLAFIEYIRRARNTTNEVMHLHSIHIERTRPSKLYRVASDEFQIVLVEPDNVS